MLNVARELGADALADEVKSISDEEVKDSAQASRQRNRIEARRWLAGVIAPRVYGNKLDLAVSVSGDAREAERRADARFLRITGTPVESVGLIIEGTSTRLPDHVPVEIKQKVLSEG
jgi:hypothetical protein